MSARAIRWETVYYPFGNVYGVTRGKESCGSTFTLREDADAIRDGLNAEAFEREAARLALMAAACALPAQADQLRQAARQTREKVA